MIKETLFVMLLFVAFTLCFFFVLWVLGYDIERKDKFGIIIGEIILIGLVSITVYIALR